MADDWFARLLAMGGLAAAGGSLWLSAHQFNRSGPGVVVDIQGSRYRNAAGGLDEVITVKVRNTGRAPFTVDGLSFPAEPSFSASFAKGPADDGVGLPVTLEAGGPSVEFQRIVRYSKLPPGSRSTMHAEVRTSDGREVRSTDGVDFPVTSGWIVG